MSGSMMVDAQSTAQGRAVVAAWRGVPRARLRPLWHWMKHLPDRALHGGRRRAALRALQRRAPFDSVVFVCQGNIYRSPYAAALLLARLSPSMGQRLRVASAGFVGPGRPSPDDAQALAAERSLDLSTHRSQLLSAPLLAGRALCIVMDPVQLARVRATSGFAGQLVLNLGDLDPEPITARAVPDPWKGEPAVLRASYARIDRCVAVLLEALGDTFS